MSKFFWFFFLGLGIFNLVIFVAFLIVTQEMRWLNLIGFLTALFYLWIFRKDRHGRVNSRDQPNSVEEEA